MSQNPIPQDGTMFNKDIEHLETFVNGLVALDKKGVVLEKEAYDIMENLLVTAFTVTGRMRERSK